MKNANCKLARVNSTVYANLPFSVPGPSFPNHELKRLKTGSSGGQETEAAGGAKRWPDFDKAGSIG
jgi:hypothetical protein